MPDAETPLILALTSDYFLIPRIEDAAAALEYQIEIVESPEGFRAEGKPIAREIPLTEPTEGPDGTFVREIVDRRPALLLIDLSSEVLPWERWIQILKTSAATRRIPILAFGPHVDKQTLERAARSGADQVVSRGRFQSSLVELIRAHAHVVEMGSACEGALSALAAEGLELLNSGHYYEAHEPLENAWMEASEMEGYLYRVLLQIAIAYLQVERENLPGAQKMVLRLQQWLDPLPDRCRGVDVAGIRSNIEAFANALEGAGSEGISEVREFIRPVPMHPS